jgi:hypothetical protein
MHIYTYCIVLYKLIKSKNLGEMEKQAFYFILDFYKVSHYNILYLKSNF